MCVCCGVHVEEYKHMKDVIVDETVGDMDKDNDGFIAVEEYIGEPRPLLLDMPHTPHSSVTD